MTSYPSCRFYAGACLILDNVKVGALCVLDYKPHTSFTETERMNLLDIASAISHLIAERRDSIINNNKNCAKMMNEIMLNVRSPIPFISSTSATLLADLTKKKENFDSRMLNVIKTLKMASKSSGNYITNRILDITNDIELVHTEIETQTSLIIADLQSSVGRLEIIVEASLCLGQFAIEKAEYEKKEWASFTSANVLQTIIDARNVLNHIKDTANITWDVDTSLLCKGSRHIYSPKAVYFLLLNSVEQLVSHWNTINVKIFFKDTGDVEYDSIVQQLDEVPICDIESIWQQGLLTIGFDLSDKIDDEIGVDDISVKCTPKSPLSFYSLHQVLEDVEGGFTKLDTGSSYFQNMSFWMPLAIVINEDKEKIVSTGSAKSFQYTSSDNSTLIQNLEHDSREGTIGETKEKIYKNVSIPETKADKISFYNTSTSADKRTIDKGTTMTALDLISGVEESNVTDNNTYSNTFSNPFSLKKRSVSYSDDGNSYDQDEEVRIACKRASTAAASKAATDAAFVLSALVDADLRVDSEDKVRKKRFSFPKRKNSKAVIPEILKKVEKKPIVKLRILLVDDTLSVQKLMGRWLKNQGCEVTYAQNGKIGLYLLKTQQFDICFMDFLMVRYAFYQ